LSGIPAADYERAYTYMVGAIRAKQIVDDMLERLEKHPDDGMVLDPKFIALLALFSPDGRKLANATMLPSVVRSHQRDLAARYESIRTEFANLLEPED